jgi:uncharacterized protein YndB with AHSA1/START domain
MSRTREHTVQIELPAPPESVFDALVRPSAIRSWWGASRVMVVPEAGGVWAAAWGDDEDDPQYVTTARMQVFEPPTRIRFADYSYYARTGKLPFDAVMQTEFTVRPAPGGSILRVVQSGFPTDSIADDFYAACGRGWRETLESLRTFLEEG